MTTAGLPVTPLSTWLRRAWWLAVATIAYNLVEGAVSMAFGAADASVALFGFGVDSFIEVASAVLVLWRLRGEAGTGALLPLERERRATQGIGLLLVLLALGTAVASSLQLLGGRHPDTTLPGVVIAVASLSFMFFLWSAKRRTARALDSATLAQDAACSLACIQLSVVLLVGSVVHALVPALWWADAAAALALALLIGREGVGAVRAARSEHFAGGCGCGGACHDAGRHDDSKVAGRAPLETCGCHEGPGGEVADAARPLTGRHDAAAGSGHRPRGCSLQG